jgi:hypothetical protein
VKGSGLRRPARDDERLERLQLAVARVDCMLELRDAAVIDPGLLEMSLHFLAIRRGEQRADGEQVPL